MMTDLLPLLLIVLCLGLEGFFSGGEIAYVTADVNRIRQQAGTGSRSAKLALKLLENPDWLFATTLTGTNLCIVTSTILATSIFISLFGVAQGERISALVMIPTLMVMIVTRSFFQQYAEFFAVRIARLVWTASWLFYPVVYLISRISKRTVLLSVKGRELSYSPYITKKGLLSILGDQQTESDILGTEKDMVKRILDFTSVTVGEIKVPLSAISALPVTTTLSEAAAFAAEKKYLRIPVYRDQMFNIIGVLHYFDLLKAIDLCEKESPDCLNKRTIETCLSSSVLYVPETKAVKELLIELQARREHMAFVVDEYGGGIGIVTVEDILETIVGEIDDEYDERETQYRRIGPDRYLFDARIRLDRLQQIVPVPLPEGEYETLGGFLLSKIGRIPRRKETVRLGNAVFVIDDADMKRIKEVLVILSKGTDQQDAPDRQI
jgi:putative hemolysin